MTHPDGVVVERADSDAGQVDDERVARCPRAGNPGARRQDRAHVAGPEPAELDRPPEGGHEGLFAVGRLHGAQLGEVAARVVTPRAAAPLMNASATGPRAQNACSAGVLGRTARAGSGRGPP